MQAKKSKLISRHWCLGVADAGRGLAHGGDRTRLDQHDAGAAASDLPEIRRDDGHVRAG